jgi:Kef-type K+ transport system membrane component KefB
MLGMILFGYLSKKLLPSIITTIPHSWKSVIWTLALSSVLCRAGLSLQSKKIVKFTTKIACLGTIPVVTEAILVGFIAQKIFDVPISWAFTISFGIASISPGLVVPLILKLIDNGWKDSRIPPILLTSLGIDVLIGTAGFGIALSSCFGHGHEKEENWFHTNWFTRAFEDVFIGLVMGLVMGFLSLLYLKFRVPDSISTVIMYITSSIAMIWCKTNDFIGAASFSTFITWGFVANTYDEVQIGKMDGNLKYFWIFFKPYLFPVIGSTISFEGTSNLTIVKVFVVIVIALFTKMLAAFAVCILCGFDRSESVFVCGVWAGKASIQVFND